MRRAIIRKIGCLVSVLVVLGLCACGNKEDSMTSVDTAGNSAMQIEENSSDTEIEINSIETTLIKRE